ncbi:rhodanese-like domain-containing protein [Bacillus marinisedimentorum]|uniref:rhodanese-like domain-containing protein n=1 Tax=Bacillus marinisedimentorum TaxID=1821260 RepID=UPI0009F2B455|nr:rhodanese-like domain-containing protein [Bacillus marinisedimentorum]
MPVMDITPTSVNELHKTEGLNILDVREPYEFAAGKIPGSINIPLGFLLQSLDQLDKGKEYIVVCRSGNRSSLGSQLLESRGYKVKNMEGGLMSWTGDLN